MTRDELIKETSEILGKSTKYMALNQVITELVQVIKGEKTDDK